MKINAKVGVIHIASESVCAALVKTGGMPDVLGFQRERVLETLPDMEAQEVQAQALQKAIEPIAAQAEAWVICVDSSWSVARRLTIPFRGRSRVKSAVPFELEPHLPFPIEDVAVDYAVTNEQARETEVLAIAVRRSVLENQLAVCRLAGIIIEGIGLDVIGLTALFSEKYQKTTGPQVVLHVFDQNAALVVLERHKLKDFIMLPFGAEQFQHRPQETWKSIGNAIRSADTIPQTADEALVLNVCGYEHPEDKNDAHALPSNVTPFFESDLLPLPPASDPADNRMRDVMAGCALAASGGNPALNFLDPPLRAGDRPPGLARRAGMAASLAAALFVLVVGFRYVEYSQNSARVEAIGRQVYQVLADTFPDRPEAQTRPPGDIGGFKSFELMQTAADEESDAIAAFSPEAFQRPTLLAVLLDISQRMPAKSVTVTDMKITTGRNNEVTVYGEADSAEALNAMLRNLRDSSVVTLDERRLTRSSARGRETFELVARF